MITWPEDIDSSELVMTYVAANTPAYLFKRLRSSDSVNRLAKAFAPEELGELCTTLLSSPVRRQVDVARAYALIVALGAKDDHYRKGVLRALDLAVLDWGNAIRGMITARDIPTGTVTISPLPVMPLPAGAVPGSVKSTPLPPQTVIQVSR